MIHNLMRYGRATGAIVAAALLAHAAGGGEAAEPAEGVAVRVRNLTQDSLQNIPVTFGQAFRRGHVPPGKMVHCLIDDTWAQVDPKRRHEDGSLRFAVVSVVLPKLGPGGSKTLRLVGAGPRPGRPLPPITLAPLLKTDFDAVVTLTFPDGTVRSVSARKLLARTSRKAPTWLRGHAATEWLVRGVPIGPGGKADEDLSVRFQVRAYAGCKRVRVSVVVENCWDTWAGNVRFDVAVAVGGKEVFAKRAVAHR